jgi:UDP-glucose 4-epimerase
MRKAFPSDKLKFYLGDVREFSSIRNAMYGVDYVFHAAALKQVPSCEFFPIEAVKTNILGTENVLDAAIDAQVKKVICLSTDKAAYPINAMGISKAMMEKVFVAKAKRVKETIICGTRYGNVMASRGSVIPLFIEQIKAKKPLTLTNPEMTRFLMSLEDAVQLVLFAFIEAKAGDIMVQKAPASTIGDLAAAMSNLLSPNHPVTVMGPRHGEKLYETLLTQEERLNAIEYDHYFRVPADTRDLNYEKYFLEGSTTLGEVEAFHSHNTKRLVVKEIEETLRALDIIKDALKGFK